MDALPVGCGVVRYSRGGGGGVCVVGVVGVVDVVGVVGGGPCQTEAPAPALPPSSLPASMELLHSFHPCPSSTHHPLVSNKRWSGTGRLAHAPRFSRPGRVCRPPLGPRFEILPPAPLGRTSIAGRGVDGRGRGGWPHDLNDFFLFLVWDCVRHHGYIRSFSISKLHKRHFLSTEVLAMPAPFSHDAGCMSLASLLATESSKSHSPGSILAIKSWLDEACCGVMPVPLLLPHPSVSQTRNSAPAPLPAVEVAVAILPAAGPGPGPVADPPARCFSEHFYRTPFFCLLHSGESTRHGTQG